jgi:hypothetical protein
MAAQGGYGVPLKINTGSLTTIVGVTDVDFPEFMNYVAESTGHDSSGGYYEAVATGKKRVQPFPATLNWDTAEATHAAIVTAFDAGTAVGMSIEDPDGDEVISFSAIVEKIGRVSRQEDRYYAVVTFHPTGAPSIA